jgi:hypothetical protein
MLCTNYFDHKTPLSLSLSLILAEKTKSKFQGTFEFQKLFEITGLCTERGRGGGGASECGRVEWGEKKKLITEKKK